MTEINFEYFDPEVELGTLDENGRPIRPRKKPGRKPNPPSPAQRKAQNRQAQRAFRERKRREMKEAENNIKKCLQQRDQAIRKANSLQRNVNELRYENNYLRGMVLTLKLACLSNGVNVPKFWNTGSVDNVGADIPSLSRSEGIPQTLEFFLDKNRHIIAESPENVPPSPSPAPPPSQPSSFSMPTPSIPSQSKHATTSLSSHSPTTANFDAHFGSPTCSISMANPTPPPPSNSDPNVFTPFDPSSKPSFYPPTSQAAISPSVSQVYPQPSTHLLQPPSAAWADPSPPTPSSVFMPSSSLISDQTRQSFPPMSAADAITFLRNLNRGKPASKSVYTPTELQRHVPHDARIDFVPGPLIRDHMILFQGFYDANTLFSFLIKQCIFLGGDLGNPDCWYVPPVFFQNYWFLMPNHRPRRVDNAIELAVNQGRTLSRMLFQRKKMYIERDRYLELFPPTTLSNKEERRSLTDKDSETDPWEEVMDEQEQPDQCDDVPLDVVLDLMESLPKLTSPNVFTF
ncbi:hypothetical protein DM01DRAFT_1406457 [Hesseltinella vesiculosa]|uniref:BZIP domain-containing protein n=1 Tax=Hesseltinella vesiculosa TaxID=101127 RepID=A0A1X2GMA0_9FUNG|nr:hypothetical protein DM01DRAFT_1406457 [Hesseltinella vesiculosa]